MTKNEDVRLEFFYSIPLGSYERDSNGGTAWDSEIESLTSLDASLIELDRRKTRRRHRVTAALAPSKSCFLPCNAKLHASSASLKHGLRHRRLLFFE